MYIMIILKINKYSLNIGHYNNVVNENINLYLNVLDIDYYLMNTNCMHVNL